MQKMVKSLATTSFTGNFWLKNVNILVTILKVKRQNKKNNKKNGNYQIYPRGLRG